MWKKSCSKNGRVFAGDICDRQKRTQRAGRGYLFCRTSVKNGTEVAGLEYLEASGKKRLDRGLQNRAPCARLTPTSPLLILHLPFFITKEVEEDGQGFSACPSPLCGAPVRCANSAFLFHHPETLGIFVLLRVYTVKRCQKDVIDFRELSRSSGGYGGASEPGDRTLSGR